MSLTPISQVFKDPPHGIPYPKWVSSNKIFKKHSNIRKIFPEIGLKNESEPYSSSDAEACLAAKTLLSSIAEEIGARHKKLQAFILSGKKISDERKTNILALANNLYSICQIWHLTPLKDSISVKTNGILELKVGIDLNSALKLKKNMSLIKLYGQISNTLKQLKCLPLRPIEELAGFKQFSSLNKPSSELKIVFSCDGKEGIWDIATMSMRGITSCQSWNSTGQGQACRVVGSITDPYTAIIYLTRDSKNSKPSHGSTMIRRCVVRYVIDVVSGEEKILLEKMYPSYDKYTEQEFIKFLAKRTALRILSINTANHFSDIYKCQIPVSDEMKSLQLKYYPYVDSRIIYSSNLDCKFNLNYESIISDFSSKINKLFIKAIRSNLFSNKRQKEIDDLFSKSESEWISVMRGRKLDAPPILDIAKNYMEIISKIFPNKNPFAHNLFLDGKVHTQMKIFLMEKFSLRSKFAHNIVSIFLQYFETHLCS